jgi:pimeloyl-ACP methyl ester carboxylesterase
MPFAEVNGGQIAYEVLGEGHPVVLTPGGRFSRDYPGVRPLAEKLAKHFQVILWDRRNTGQSSMYFDGPSESQLWADDLAELVRVLGFRSAFLVGGSAGSRTSLTAALRHPEIADKLVLWWISGGLFGQLVLAPNYNIPFIIAARRGGMAAVAELPEFEEQLASNKANREYLSSLDPEYFIAVMKRWMSTYIPEPDVVIPGVRAEDLAGLDVPTLVFRGSPIDDFHPREVTEAIAEGIPGARLVDPPWGENEWWDLRQARDEGRGNLFDNWHLLAPQIIDFLMEAA